MQDFSGMKTLEADHDLDCELPNCFLLDRFAHLALYELREVAFDTILHHDEEFGPLDKRVVALNNERRIDFLHEFCFIHRPLFESGIESGHLNFLDDKYLSGFFELNFVHDSEWAFSQFGDNLVFFKVHGKFWVKYYSNVIKIRSHNNNQKEDLKLC